MSLAGTSKLQPSYFRPTAVNQKVRIAIEKRARDAVTKDDLVRAVFDSYLAENIEPRSVSLADMKVAIVWAASAARAPLPAAA